MTFTDYELFPWSICNGCGMPAGNAYPSGHLVPSPFWDLLMLQLLRPNSSNLPCLYSTFHLEYPLVLSRFCFGQNPANQTYDARQMRSHLIGCLENKTMTTFPVVRFSGKRKSIKKSIAIEIFCLCRLPDTNELYVFCDECSSEFHPECVNITKPITNSMKFTCPKCLIK